MGFKNLPAMNIEIVALWNVAPCFLVLCYQWFKKCCGYGLQILPKFCYIATKLSKENDENADSRFFQNSGTFLRFFRRKLLKI
jgi:hypothetical protein